MPIGDYPELVKLQNIWENPITGMGSSGMAFALLVIITIIFAIALFYMLASAFRNERLKRWLVGELMQTFASILMVVGLVALALLLADASFEMMVGQTLNVPTGWGTVPTLPATIAGPIDYLKGKLLIIDFQLDALYTAVVKTNMVVERQEWTCFIFFGSEVKCGWDLHPRVEIMHALAYKLVQLRVAVNAQLALADYISEHFLWVFLPLGIVLRAFPFTRGAGGLIIAVVLGFYFIYPLLFTISDISLNLLLERPDTSFADPGLTNKCVFNDVSAYPQLMAQMPADMAQNVDLFAGEAQKIIAALVLEVILAPLMALAATVLFIRAVSPMLGAESQDVMYGITKLL